MSTVWRRVFHPRRIFPLRLFVLLLTLVVIAGCTPTLPKDESILTQIACKFPCWHGVTPGQSIKADVEQLLKTDPFIASSSILGQASDGAGRDGFQWWYDGFNRNNRILFENGIIHSISINPNLEFSLQDVISRYGEPDGVNAFLSTSMEGGVVNAELYLYYPQLGLRVGFPIPGGSVVTTNQFNIEASILGGGFTLVEPQNSLNDFIAEIYRLSDDNLSQILRNITLGWPGFNSRVVINPNRRAFYDATFIVTATPNLEQ